MRKISAQKAKALAELGVSIDADGDLYMPDSNEEGEAPRQDNGFVRDAIASILHVMKQQEKTSETMATAILKLSEPAPKREWNCVVERDYRGNISKVNIKEK